MSGMEAFRIIPLAVLCYGAYAWTLGNFFRKNLQCTGADAGAFSLIYFMGCAAAMLIVEIWYMPFIVTALTSHLLFLGLIMALFKAEPEKKIFAAAILTAVNVLVGNFGSSLLSCLVLFIKNAMKTAAAPYISLEGGCFIGCLSIGITIGVIKGLSGRLTPLFHGRTKRWYIWVTLPLIFIVAIVDVVNYAASIGIMVVSDANGPAYWSLYYNELFSHIAICILTLLSMCAAGFYIFGMNRIYLEQRKKEQYKAQAAFYKMLEEEHGRMERLRHDMKNHLISLKGLWEHSQWDKMGSYLTQMMEAGDMKEGEELTGNKAVDALLYQKSRQAKAEGIIWESDVHLPADCPIDEFDLCVLIGNMLDNAIEACERLGEGEVKFIKMQSGMVKKCLLLEVKNSAGLKDIGAVKFTQKEISGEHGIGLLNIRETVNKYSGTMDMEIQKGVFLISILIPFNESVL